ncbi:MAG: hypothetical protein ACYCVO_16290 [Acidimicrobiales bacterium]
MSVAVAPAAIDTVMVSVLVTGVATVTAVHPEHETVGFDVQSTVPVLSVVAATSASLDVVTVLPVALCRVIFRLAADWLTPVLGIVGTVLVTAIVLLRDVVVPVTFASVTGEPVKVSDGVDVAAIVIAPLARLVTNLTVANVTFSVVCVVAVWTSVTFTL